MEERDITTIGGFIKPFWFPFASVYVPVTPCVLDGSLSFLEMVWKLLHDLNKVVEAANANHTDILTLVSQIEILAGQIAGKLSYLEVNFTENDDTITADKTVAEISAAYDDKIVIGRGTFDGKARFYIALAKSAGPSAGRESFRFYSLDGSKIDEILVTENEVTRTVYELITTEGGTITGALNVPTPTQNAHAATKKYVDDQDAATLVSAKNYANNNFVANEGNSGSTYGTRTQTDRFFTDIPTGPSTITINALLAKLGRWYVEITNKVRNVTISPSGTGYAADMPFEDVYQLVIEGDEIRCIFTSQDANRSKNVLRVENYGSNQILFKNNDIQLLYQSNGTITVTQL